ncbi:helix-turn-helix domain-containing protein [Psychroserpens mesophilus]|uniref:helix-turn-helix domain-containing protein n=1 Tax=Psychroserpens mesophilus TaxID=325473 RepID=UPI003F494169
MFSNNELDLAWNFVNKTNRNIFLTGKAGTGKTTFLHKLKLNSSKRMVIVAPTGVAAINAKGTTIHSFFQLPFGPILPNDLSRPNNFNRKFSKNKISIIKSLDLLVIDEISMVRADLLDGIDNVLRQFKNKKFVFGGVQLLMIGDLQQLSPVVKHNDWDLLKEYYSNAFFFNSRAYNQCDPITIELKQVYRQSDPKFIKILNEIRANSLSKSSRDELNKLFRPDFIPQPNQGYISLTTHNNIAEKTNRFELDKLNTQSQTYNAIIEGDFPDHLCPNKKELVLKVGAQVMFIKNDSSIEKRFFNGKIGIVIFLDKHEVIVKCPDDDFNIVTTPEIWENITYTIDDNTKAISERVIGSFSQMPLRLAWSITIHKSQGLTFEKAIIDVQGAFAHGQTYVAISRCKSLEGLVLRNKINSNHIISDSNVIDFNKQAEESQPDETILNDSKKEFQLALILETFDYYSFIYPFHRILDIYYNNKRSIEGNIDPVLHNLKTAVSKLLKVCHSFKLQILDLSNGIEEPQNNSKLQERFLKALDYFKSETNKTIEIPYNTLIFITDNKKIESDIQTQLDRIDELLAEKNLYFDGLKEGFETTKFLELRGKSIFLNKEKPKKLKKLPINALANSELFELLRELRNTIAHRESLIHYQIFTQKTLYALCEILPRTISALKEIHGMGKTRVAKYGLEIIEVITSYCESNNITSIPNPKGINTQNSTRKKSNTKKESLILFQSGKSVEEIANARELTINTIYGHLASFIPSGEVKTIDLISKSHYSELKSIIPTKTFDSLSDLKHQIDDKYSYVEIRLVLDELSK